MAKSDDDVLEELASGQTMDYKQWPDLLQRLLSRLDQISRTEFPIPQIPLPTSRPRPFDQQISSNSAEPSSQDSSSQSSQATNKENAPPSSPPKRPPVPSFVSPSSSSESTTIALPDGTLPPPLKSLLESTCSTLTTHFATSPPHTVQRLAELILRPRQHYRFLPSYLRALDRVVSVSSGAHLFPLPTANVSEGGEGGLLNGTSGIISDAGTLGSDESLGGALLTPIPWLRNDQPMVRTENTEMIDGPNGAGSIETVSVSAHGLSSNTLASHSETLREAGGVTQGELLRQEQQAGEIPVAQVSARQTRSATAWGTTEEASKSEEEEHVHARGPDKVGVEDMGPQERNSARHGFDVEAALGRNVAHKPTEQSMEDKEPSEGSGSDEVMEDKDKEKDESKDEDVLLVDADGKTEAEEAAGQGADASEENVGA